MKIKDLIKSLGDHDPEAEVVFRPLYQNPLEPKYVMKRVRAYIHGGRVVIDGYDREVIRGN